METACVRVRSREFVQHYARSCFNSTIDRFHTSALQTEKSLTDRTGKNVYCNNKWNVQHIFYENTHVVSISVQYKECHCIRMSQIECKSVSSTFMKSTAKAFFFVRCVCFFFANASSSFKLNANYFHGVWSAYRNVDNSNWNQYVCCAK